MILSKSIRTTTCLSLLALLLGITTPHIAAACDVCGCYFGLMPFERLHRTDVVWRYSRFNGYRNIPQSPQLPSPQAQPHRLFKTVHDPIYHAQPGQEPVYSKDDFENFHTLEVRSAWFVTKRLNLAVVLPYRITQTVKVEEPWRTQGLGDAQITPTYFPVWYDDPTWGIRWGIQAGVKMPTGAYQTDEPAAESLLLVGTGGWDFMPGTHIWLRRKEWGLALSAMYRLSTKNSLNFQLLPTLNTQMVFFRGIKLGENSQLLPNAGLYYENFDGAELDGYWLRGTGGQMLSAHMGIDAYYKYWGISIQVQKPLVQDLLGTQLGNAGRINVGINYNIPTRLKPQGTQNPVPQSAPSSLGS